MTKKLLLALRSSRVLPHASQSHILFKVKDSCIDVHNDDEFMHTMSLQVLTDSLRSLGFKEAELALLVVRFTQLNK